MKDGDAIDIAGSLIVQALQLFLLFVTKSIMMDKCPQFVVNADSSHLIDELKNEKELRASLRFYEVIPYVLSDFYFFYIERNIEYFIMCNGVKYYFYV